MTSITETADNDQPIVPIYGPSDARWEPLRIWMEANVAAERETTIEDLSPIEAAGWYEQRVLGSGDSHFYLRPVSYPDFPDTPAPAWATSTEDGGIDSLTERPSRYWVREVSPDDAFPAAVGQLATFNPETGLVDRDPVRLSVWTSGDVQVTFESPADVRRLAAVLLEVAAEFEQAVS